MPCFYSTYHKVEREVELVRRPLHATELPPHARRDDSRLHDSRQYYSITFVRMVCTQQTYHNARPARGEFRCTRTPGPCALWPVMREGRAVLASGVREHVLPSLPPRAPPASGS